MQKLTNKEAVEVLDEMRKYSYSMRSAAALALAIEAMEKENGSEAMRNKILSVLKENQSACKTLTPEDAARSAQEMVNETYEDLISIISKIQPAKSSWVSVGGRLPIKLINEG